MPTMATPHDPISGIQGIQEAKNNHQANMKDRLSKIIDDALGHELPLPEGYKPSFKLENNNATKYSGSSKMIDLEEWLATTVNRLALQRLGGNRPEIDRVRVMLLLEQLEGAAHKWMLRHVTHVNREIEQWTFQDVIHGLYTRFVHPSSMQDARENLNKVLYIPRDGIQTLYDSMLEHAGGMAVFPDDYTMLSIFLDKIPQYMMSELLNLRGLSPEVNNLSEFVANAIDIEQRKKNEDYYIERRTTRNNPRRDNKYTKTREPPQNKGGNDTRSTNDKVVTQDNVRKYGQFRKGFTHTKPWNKAKIQDKKHDHAIVKHDKPKQHWSKKPMKAKHDNANSGCFNCGSLDHFSRDCTEPRKNKTFVRAVRSAHEDSDDERGENSTDEEGGSDALPSIPEGNEDQSPDERIEIETPMGNEYYEEDGSDEHMFGMRTCEYPDTEADHMMATVVFPLKGNETPREIRTRKHKLIPSRKTRMRPKYSEEDKRCMATWVEINGLKAWTLWDSGSTTTGITPSFAEIARIPVDELTDPHVLQLGTVGSRSEIKYGTDVDIDIGGNKMRIYVDIANFDRYEMIIGTPFMRRNQVILDFKNNEIIINEKRIPALTVSAKEAELFARRQRTTDKKGE